MANLTDTQLIILAAAANRDDGAILPLPRTSRLDRETADGVVTDLLKKKLVAERPAVGPAAIWREGDAGQPITLIITSAGLRAIAAEPRRPSGAKAKQAKKARTGTCLLRRRAGMQPTRPAVARPREGGPRFHPPPGPAASRPIRVNSEKLTRELSRLVRESRNSLSRRWTDLYGSAPAFGDT